MKFLETTVNRIYVISVTVLFLIFSFFAQVFIDSKADAALLTTRAVQMSSSAKAATGVSYVITFTSTASPVRTRAPPIRNSADSG